jgi:hypothetical protein
MTRIRQFRPILVYQGLGRRISDVATIPTGSIVDRSVQRLDTADDTQGTDYLFTS